MKTIILNKQLQGGVMKTKIIISIIFLFLSATISYPQNIDKRDVGIGMAIGIPFELDLSIFSVNTDKVIGFYGAVRFGIPSYGSNEYYYDNIQEKTFNDPRVDEHWDKMAIEGGMTFAVSKHNIFYIAGGIERQEFVLELRDPLYILGGRDGHYYVSGNDSQVKPNLSIGIINFGHNSSFGSRVGIHTTNPGVEIGLVISFPFIYKS